MEKKFKTYIYHWEEAPESISIETVLNPTEMTYFLSCKNAHRREQFLKSRYWLKKILLPHENPQDVTFLNQGDGKLVLPENNCSFNLSHSGDYCAIVLSDHGDVGIDVQKIQKVKNFKTMEKKFFSHNENIFLNHIDILKERQLAFFKLWSGKEAIIKAMGGGVFKNITDVHIDCQQWTIEKLPTHFGNIKKWELNYIHFNDDYILCVAFKKT